MVHESLDYLSEGRLTEDIISVYERRLCIIYLLDQLQLCQGIEFLHRCSHLG